MHAASCSGWQKIEPKLADVDAISSKLARQIDAHNQFGLKQGCWKR